MKYASKRIQEVLKKGEYMQINLHRATQHGLAKSLQVELNIALKKVNELNEKQQQAQFDFECLEHKMKFLKAE